MLKQHYIIVFILISRASILSGQKASTPESNPEHVDLFTLPLERLLEIKIASTRPQHVLKVPSSVSVIEGAQLEQYNFQTIAEAISTVSGMSIVRTAARIEIPTGRWVLQDHYPNKVLVMIDGLPVWETNTGAATLGRLSPSDLQRIEIIKGPASVLYGSNAYVGAINFILKDSSDGIKTNVYGGVAEYSGSRAGGNYQYRDGDYKFSMSANGFTEDGKLESLTDSEGVKGYFRDFRNYNNFTLAVENGSHSLTSNYYREYQTKLGVDPIFYKGIGKPHRLSGFMLDYKYNIDLHEDLLLFSGVTYDFNERIYPRRSLVKAAEPQFPDNIDGEEDSISEIIGYRSQAYVKGDWILGPLTNVEFGLEYDYRETTEYQAYNTSTNGPMTQYNLRGRSVYEGAAYVQLGHQINKFSYLLGSRLTSNEFYNENVSSRGTIVYLLDQRQSLKLMVGQSFRAPSLFELFFLSPSKTTSGNSDLRPEKSVSSELTYLFTSDNLFFQTNIYQAIYYEKIYRQRYTSADEPDRILADGSRLGDSGVASANIYDNGGMFSAVGLELEIKYKFNLGNIFFNYIHTNGDVGEQDPSDFNFKYPPKHKAVTGVYLQQQGYFGSIVATYYSEMKSVTETIPQQGKGDFNLGFIQKLKLGNIRHTFSIKNTLDSTVVGPDYVDLDENMPTLPWEQSRRISYTVSLSY